MGRKAKPCAEKCQKHLLSLKPVHYSAFFSREISMLFCSYGYRPASIIHKFNKDGKFYTPSFSLPIDKKKNKDNDAQLKQDHDKIRKQSAQPKLQMIPKPRARNSFCNVCRYQYKDYLEHIESIKHKQLIKANKFQEYIQELCSIFQSETKNQIKQCSTMQTIRQESHEQGYTKNQDFYFISKPITEMKLFTDIVTNKSSKTFCNTENYLGSQHMHAQNNSSILKRSPSKELGCELKTTADVMSPTKFRVEESDKLRKITPIIINSYLLCSNNE